MLVRFWRWAFPSFRSFPCLVFSGLTHMYLRALWRRIGGSECLFSWSENDSTDTQCGCFFVNSMFLHQFACPLKQVECLVDWWTRLATCYTSKRFASLMVLHAICFSFYFSDCFLLAGRHTMLRCFFCRNWTCIIVPPFLWSYWMFFCCSKYYYGYYGESKYEAMAFESDVLKPHGPWSDLLALRIQAWMHISSWNVCDNNWRSGMGVQFLRFQGWEKTWGVF